MIIPAEFTNGARKPRPEIPTCNAPPFGIAIISGLDLLLPSAKLNEPFPDDFSLLTSELIFFASA